LGKNDNCPVAIYRGSASGGEHALVDTRLYLPTEWASDRQRCKKAGLPKEVRYRRRHQLCLEMLAQNGQLLPHAWIAPAWRTTKFATGKDGITIRSSRSSPRGSWSPKPVAEKKWTPAITVQQIRERIALLLHRACECGTTSRILHACEQRLKRNELARWQHWKRRKRLAPLNINKRQI
jgi:SRSO17 transposase